MYKLKRYPTDKELIKIAKIISWNIWQMDGLVYTIPFKKPISSNNQILLFEFEEEHNDNYCVIKDWRANKKNCIQRFVK